MSEFYNVHRCQVARDMQILVTDLNNGKFQAALFKDGDGKITSATYSAEGMQHAIKLAPIVIRQRCYELASRYNHLGLSMNEYIASEVRGNAGARY